MEWFKKAFGFSFQDKVIDPLAPEGYKKESEKLFGDLGRGGKFSQFIAQALAGQDAIDTGRLTPEESEDIVKKTFSRLGRIFTSPMGLTGPFSTGKQKVFS